MNREAFLKVADAIEANPEQFDLTMFYSTTTPEQFAPGHCGTTACVAGWAATLAAAEANDATLACDPERGGRRYLDIEPSQAERLFFGDEHTVWAREAHNYDWDITSHGALSSWGQVTGPQAVEVLRGIANGTIDL